MQRTQHMALVDKIVTRLKSVPEGGGTMFDNTMLFYFPDGGRRTTRTAPNSRSSSCMHDNARLNLGRRYIRLP
ncbi:MAG: hypothetical protein R3F11_15350 [Verrucomicrobiales bacterium]